jgi:hypothetical protein
MAIDLDKPRDLPPIARREEIDYIRVEPEDEMTAMPVKQEDPFGEYGNFRQRSDNSYTGYTSRNSTILALPEKEPFMSKPDLEKIMIVVMAASFIIDGILYAFQMNPILVGVLVVTTGLLMALLVSEWRKPTMIDSV